MDGRRCIEVKKFVVVVPPIPLCRAVNKKSDWRERLVRNKGAVTLKR